MTVTTTEESTPATTGDQSGAAPTSTSEAPAVEGLVESDLLVEDVSIDGMCGVY